MGEIVGTSGIVTAQGEIIGTPANLADVLAAGNSAGGSAIQNLGAPSASGDAATKGYVDGLAVRATREAVQAVAPLNIANNAVGDLPLEHGSGASLLDFAVPAAPTLKAAGLYALSGGVIGITLTAGGIFSINVALPTSPVMRYREPSSPPSVAANNSPCIAFGVVFPGAANAPLVLTVANADGAAARDFSVTDLWLTLLF